VARRHQEEQYSQRVVPFARRVVLLHRRKAARSLSVKDRSHCRRRGNDGASASIGGSANGVADGPIRSTRGYSRCLIHTADPPFVGRIAAAYALVKQDAEFSKQEIL
jgi:hypothetical protein